MPAFRSKIRYAVVGLGHIAQVAVLPAFRHAARVGVHVLCEKPMAVTVEECRQMIAACRAGGVKLMIAYRLHFEEANLDAVDLARRGRIGKLKFFNSTRRPKRASPWRLRPPRLTHGRLAGNGCQSGAARGRAS